MLGFRSIGRPGLRLARLSPAAIVATTLALTASTALAQQAQQVTITTTESAFSPKTVTLTVGRPVPRHV